MYIRSSLATETLYREQAKRMLGRVRRLKNKSSSPTLRTGTGAHPGYGV